MQNDPSSSVSETNTFPFDLGEVPEMASFIDHYQTITKAMGGPLAEQNDLSHFSQMLDLACGPGSWVLDVAHANTHIDVAGVDANPMMVEYASARARSQGLHNASFEVMDIFHPLDFSDNTFDLVNAQLLAAFVPRKLWPQILQECLRITRPGGIFRMTEVEGGGHTNSAAYEKMHRYLSQAMHAAGFGFSPDGLSPRITPMMGRLLKNAGYQNIQYRAFAIDFSAGSEAHGSIYRNTAIVSKIGQTFAVKMGVAKPDEIEQLYQQIQIDMLADDFCGIWFHLTVWGTKPL